MEKEEKAGEGKTENRDQRKKERMVFKMEVWEKSMRALLEIYKEQATS
jgi:hypothetical protein